MRIREFTMDDYDSVRQLWQACRLPIGFEEAREQLGLKLERDPGLFLVAEENDAILGTVMGAWDGRRGWVYDQAVEPRCRRTGIGRRLMEELHRRLEAKGARCISLIVDRDNITAQDFFGAYGFTVEEGQLLMQRQLTGEGCP